ncbi:hypothetical protein EVAR_92646_1 [Eumeta japonica]|uniref:Uncharacterized protein n=1 Tax=Eumeta variegata TaxID=151549 RepID=A0A4C1SXP7_EUMVA|nr:hypothetical protein EVAR_92646_1 [Eumeta japonica]
MYNLRGQIALIVSPVHWRRRPRVRLWDLANVRRLGCVFLFNHSLLTWVPEISQGNYSVNQKDRFKTAPAPSSDNRNFLALANKNPTLVSGVDFCSAAAPTANPWFRNQSLRAAPKSPKETTGRESPTNQATSSEAMSFGEDIQTLMSVLRTVGSLEMSELTRDLRSCRNSEDKLYVLVKYCHVIVKLKAI